jgi:hypothetical protein
VDLEALGGQVGGYDISARFGHPHQVAGGVNHFVSLDQTTDHVERLGYSLLLGDGEIGELEVAPV